MAELTQKQLRFIQLYTNPESKATFGNKTESYMQSFGSKNRNTAHVEAYRLLRLPHIKSKLEDIVEKTEIDFSKHLRMIDRKLESRADKVEISREELMAIRLGLEAQGKLGKGVNIGIGIQGADCASCPYRPIFAGMDTRSAQTEWDKRGQDRDRLIERMRATIPLEAEAGEQSNPNSLPTQEAIEPDSQGKT